MNMGPSAEVIAADGERVHIPLDLNSPSQFPSLAQAIKRGPPVSHGASQPQRLLLHRDTIMYPGLLSEEEILASAERLVAEEVAGPFNAEAVKAIAEQAQRRHDVVLLKVKCDTNTYHQSMMNDVELLSCRQKLQIAGKEFKLACGATCVLRVKDYDPALKYVGEQRIRLSPQHLLVSPEYDERVRGIILQTPCKEKCRLQQRFEVKLLFFSSRLRVERTFVVVDDSQASSSSGAVVASSTEAHGGTNPRPRRWVPRPLPGDVIWVGPTAS